MTAWAMAHPWMTLYLGLCLIYNTSRCVTALIEFPAKVVEAVAKGRS